MKAIFVSYNQTLTEKVNAVLDRTFTRGFSKWELTHGRGTVDGEPHYGSHAWPSMNSTIMAIVEDEKVDKILEMLHEVDLQAPQHGLRAFVLNVEKQI